MKYLQRLKPSKQLGHTILYWLAIGILLGYIVTQYRAEKQQEVYVKTIERHLAGCLDNKGGTLVVGDRIFVCKTFDTGMTL